MVAYLCPLCVSYFSIKYVDMQDKYVDQNPLPCRNIRNILTNGCKLICFKESSLMVRCK